MNMKYQGNSKMKASLIVAAAAVVIAGCSGGAKTTTSSGTGTGSDVTPADLLVTVSTVAADGLHDVTTETATVQVTAVDKNRNVLSGAAVSVVPDNTAVATVSGTQTDSNGIVTANIGVGTDRTNRQIAVVVTSGSITKTLAINVVGAKLTATLNPAVVTPGAAGSITYHLSDANNAPIPGLAVALSGAFSANGTTDSNGDFVYNYTAPATEQVLAVNAVAAGAQAASSITDAAGTIGPAQGVVQSATIDANPTTIPTNQVGSTTNQVTVRARFFDANNAPITNVRVRFDLNGDPYSIGGSLSAGTNYAYSDADGVARTTYIPGTRSSGNSQLQIRACWSNNDFTAGTCPNSMMTPVTVVSEGVSLTINTDNKIQTIESPEIYQQAFSVLVVDSAGNPKSNVPVSYSVYIPRYFKGTLDKLTGIWDYSASNLSPQSCDNEDINGNTFLDSWEDYNGDGVLEPSGTATIVPQAAGKDVTDSFGRAFFFLQYGSNYALWADYQLSFSASVAGSAGHYVYNGRLPAPSDVIKAIDTEPAFVDSPFGTDTSGAIKTITDPVTGKSGTLCYYSPANHFGP
jgi:hypothetical protein